MIDSQQNQIPAMGRLLVVVQRNPRSGSGRGRMQIRSLIKRLREHGFRVRLFRNRQTMARFLADESNQNSLRCIVGAGGDGTISDLLNRYPSATLAMLPLGTENLLARFLKIPRCGRTVADLIHQGNTRRLDTCFANNHRFLLMLSIGVDAQIVREIHRTRTGNISHLSYVIPILRCLCNFQPSRVEVHALDGIVRSASGTHVIITNIPAYGVGFPFAPLARADDGILDVRVYDGSTIWHTIWHAISVWFGFRGAENQVVRIQTSALSIRRLHSPEDIAVQADGDPAPSLPLEIKVAPASLNIIAPRSLIADEP